MQHAMWKLQGFKCRTKYSIRFIVINHQQLTLVRLRLATYAPQPQFHMGMVHYHKTTIGRNFSRQFRNSSSWFSKFFLFSKIGIPPFLLAQVWNGEGLWIWRGVWRGMECGIGTLSNMGQLGLLMVG